MTEPRSERPSDRLERALAVFVAHAESGEGDPKRLLSEHTELRDLLEPMFAAADGHEEEAAEERILGDFRLVRELGRGGMGIVHEAWQRSVDRPVALKLLAPALVESSSAVARFRREAAAMGKLRHPGIVEVHGFGSAGDQHWFAMGLVDGEPLTRCADRFRAPERAVALVVQILDALQHAHAHGLVHRDVKPGNVLVRADDSAVLTDFGLAHDERMPSVTVEGSFLGTLEYASPEQVHGAAVDARTDVWSAGVVLFELLAGKRPFARATATATMKAILTEEPPPLRQLCASAGVDLAAILDRALQKDPARRYASAVQMLADLRAWQSGGVVSVRAPGATERMLRWARREPWRAGLAAVLVLGTPLLAALLGYLWANAPRIAAATAAEASAAREAVLTSAWLAYAELTPEVGLQALQTTPADPGDVEAAIAASMLHKLAGRVEKAVQLLLPVKLHPAAKRLHDVTVGASGDLTSELQSAVPASAIESFVLGALCFDYAKDLRQQAMYRHAARHFATAVALCSEPRAAFLHWWLLATARADDDDACAAAFTAYQLHFPESPGLQLGTAMSASAVPVERSLAVLAKVDLLKQPHVHLGLAQVYQRAGRKAEAERHFRAGLEADPRNAVAWNLLADLLGNQKQFAESATAARKAVELRPDDVGSWLLLGQAQFQDPPDIEGARASFTRAVELAPGEWKPRFNLGLVFEFEGEHEKALGHFREASRLAPAQPEPASHAALMLRRMKRPVDELLANARALQVRQQDADRWLNVAANLTLLGFSEPAIAHATRATELAPQLPHMWSRLAEALLSAPQPDTARALAAARRALELGKGNDKRAVWTLARAEAASGDVAEAIKRLEDLLALGDMLPAVVRKGAETELERLRK